MESSKRSAYQSLITALSNVLESHAAIGDAVAARAVEHAERLAAMRSQAKVNNAIKQGIAASNKQS